ncbi:MAG: hypothetical protein ABI778_12050 [Ignavibacteriota bacterium]
MQNWRKDITMNQNVQPKEEAITVFCGENARINTKVSLKLAIDSAKAGKGNVLYINTVFSTRKLYEIARDVSGKVEHDNLHYRKVTMGDLQKYFGEFQELIEQENIKMLIINSWEFSNRDYGYREKALFQLKHYAEALGLQVLVYSQAKWTYETGKIARGGLGKLAVIADEIIDLNTDEIEREERESTNLSRRKINRLVYAQSKTGIGTDGELIHPAKRKLVEEYAEGELMEV